MMVGMTKLSETGRIVSADEAREHIAAHHAQIEAGWGGTGVLADIAFTVIQQAEQISAAIALHWRGQDGECPTCEGLPRYPCPTARALGVTDA